METPLIPSDSQAQEPLRNKSFFGIGFGSYRAFLSAYGGRRDGPTRCVVQGKAEWVESDPNSTELAVPVLHFLYLPYFLDMLALGLLTQIRYVFLVEQLGGGLSYVAWAGLLNRVAKIVLGSLMCNRLKSKMPDRFAWPAEYCVDFATYVSLAFSPDARAFALLSALFGQISDFGAWQNMEINYVTKQDQPHGANLRVLCRYASGFLGPILGLFVANYFPGRCRATYLATAVMYLGLALYARKVLQITGQLTGSSEEEDEDHPAKEEQKATGGQIYIIKAHLQEFLVANLFSLCTDLVRAGYAQTLNLKALQASGITKEDTTITLSVSSVFAVVFGLIVPKLIRDGDIVGFRRFSNGMYSIKRAAVPSFAVLALGHLTLACSGSLVPLLISGVFFGLGEGLSAGLRLVVTNNVVQEIQRKEREMGLHNPNQIGKLFKAMLMTNQQIALWCNAASPLVGAKYGMTVVSLLYFIVGCFATVFCMFLPSRLESDSHSKGADAIDDAICIKAAKVVRCPFCW
eukprot:gnl/MRDRNA2_/MRDRNA2_76693_c0_seq1.p1 gnl/MRDRNA2_/MRDRNA2_76693_c0~~gnl/MRDRNA2_/MRDRNA2_76693_c0_seq1.p1  ORF type:complete len:543 (-),score=86.14 gnl/MRDRNA2_/MRDRNA2_76693_c0_seq1:25-1578(-)